MEKILNNIEGNENKINSEKILEINPDHEIFKKLTTIKDEEDIKDYANVLYNEALILGGLDISNKEEFFKSLNKILTK